MKYKCTKCNKIFSQKSNFDAHNNRKIPCDYKNDHNNDNKNLNHNESLMNLNESQMNHNNKHLTNTIYCCNYCSKQFTLKTNLTRHLKLYCNEKIINGNESDSDKLMIKHLIEQNKQMNEKINELNTTLLKISKVSKGKIIKKTNGNSDFNQHYNSQSYNNISNNNQSHNNIASNNTTIQNNNNLIMNFGNENLSKLTEAEILDVLRSYPNSFIKYVKAVNLNERIPENQTVLVKNAKSNIASIVEDNKLVVKTKNKIIEELIQNRLPEIKKFAQDYREENKITKKEYEFVMSSIKFLETSFFETEDIDGNVVKGDKETVKKLKEIYKELLYQFYDYRKMVSDNIKTLLVDPLVNPIMEILDDDDCINEFHNY